MDVIEIPRLPTSPKKKRTSDASGNNEQPSVDAGAHVRCSESVAVQVSAMRSTIGMTEEDIKLREYVVKAMTTAQETQAQACENLRVLTDKLHDWARHLDEQERWLYEERRRLIEQQQALTGKHLDIATGCMKHLTNDPDPSMEQNVSKLPNTEQVQQLKTVIEVLEGNIEVLISELQIEKEARKATEEKLRAKKSTAGPV